MLIAGTIFNGMVTVFLHYLGESKLSYVDFIFKLGPLYALIYGICLAAGLFMYWFMKNTGY